VELSVDNVQVQVCMSTSFSTYSFVCPVCQLIVNKDASEAVVDSLNKAGARLMAWSLPAELSEPKLGPRITYDDLLEFHLALESGSWQDELASLTTNQ
jgi:hypothetical protein